MVGARYGWIRVQEISGFGGVFKGYAYETEPNKAIIAGAIPEPTSLALAGLWGMAALARRRRSPGMGGAAIIRGRVW